MRNERVGRILVKPNGDMGFQIFKSGSGNSDSEASLSLAVDCQEPTPQAGNPADRPGSPGNR